MACGVCGKEGHNVKTCLYEADRVAVGVEYEKSKRCECCGSYRYAIERHHTKGRGNNSHFLDVCKGCHLQCCHQGKWSNIPVKPQYCRFTENDSIWRS